MNVRERRSTSRSRLRSWQCAVAALLAFGCAAKSSSEHVDDNGNAPALGAAAEASQTEASQTEASQTEASQNDANQNDASQNEAPKTEAAQFEGPRAAAQIPVRARLSRKTDDLPRELLPNGMTRVQLDHRFGHVGVARKRQDGTLQLDCVDRPSALDHALEAAP